MTNVKSLLWHMSLTWSYLKYKQIQIPKTKLSHLIVSHLNLSLPCLLDTLFHKAILCTDQLHLKLRIGNSNQSFLAEYWEFTAAVSKILNSQFCRLTFAVPAKIRRFTRLWAQDELNGHKQIKFKSSMTSWRNSFSQINKCTQVYIRWAEH